MNCHCGEADGIQDMVGCEWSQGVKKCKVWKYISCSGVGENTSWLGIVSNCMIILECFFIYTHKCIYTVYIVLT